MKTYTVALILACAITSAAQRPQLKSEIKVSETSKPPDSTAAERPKSMKDVIPDIPAHVHAALVGVAPKLDKDEFENEKQYVERITKLLAETAIKTAPGRTLKDTVLFFSGIGQYDAERQSFNFYSIPSSITSHRVVFVQRRYGMWTETRNFMVPSVPMGSEKARTAKASLVVAVYGLPVEVTRWGFSILPRYAVTFDIVTGEIFYEGDGRSHNPFLSIEQ